MKRHSLFWKLATTLGIAGAALATAGCGQEIRVFNPAGPVASSELQLIWLQMSLTAVVIIPVIALMVFIVIRYRNKPGNTAPYQPEFTDSKTLEFIWWGIPIVIVAILGTVTMQKTFALAKSPTPNKQPLVIEVTSLDWKWLFQYPDQKIATVNYLEIPTNRPVEFLLTSNAPMNAFWVPNLGGMEYTMPGMLTGLYLQATKTGDFYGHGGNFTGPGFAGMQFHVIAKSTADFNAWVDQVANNAPDMTMADYDKLVKPSTVSELSFSSYPPGIFKQTILNEGGKYMPHNLDMLNAHGMN
ncbi:ubiquinol oxidase subunit II [Alicyclobacillus tolerans]|uniref:ubiquinol oxidase subunit II n=1 Tax=Alicyclobacillus tolerans TaxID=90970 RepID=UPI001F346BE7|nr:ubiquinol oxidase subunit II [Alicyclobacillus tolerans]MCF8565425.1 ubiquinol oxidase subunit II [Alicyclobacillus tolerans]